MTMPPVRDIVIVGGGTAGWMTAAAMSRFLGSDYAVRLVESDEIGTVGVGEATIPQIRLFNRALGLDEDEFLRATQGTIKLGIEFADWARPGHSYIHAFGNIGQPLGMASFHHYWLKGLRQGIAQPLHAYATSGMAAYANRMMRGPLLGNPANGELVHAFHFDACAQERGVSRTEGRVTSVKRDGETGDVTHLLMESGEAIAGDLFVDCSGFRGLLIEEALHTGYEDWTHWLPCDRAIAVPCANAKRLTPYTRSTARDAGWQWRIPLQHRIGNGHVFSSAHMSEDEATAILLANLDGEALAEPRAIQFKTGRRKAFWNHNVVALGLASGFLEPLESTSIHLIQSSIERLLKFLPQGRPAPAEVAAYNEQAAFEFERIRDFIILHYHVQNRPGAFWQACRDMAVPESLTEKIELFRANGRIFRSADELFTEEGWLQVMAGQGLMPQGYHPLADILEDQELVGFLGSIRQGVERAVAAMPSHEDYIAQYCAAGVS